MAVHWPELLLNLLRLFQSFCCRGWGASCLFAAWSLCHTWSQPSCLSWDAADDYCPKLLPDQLSVFLSPCHVGDGGRAEGHDNDDDGGSNNETIVGQGWAGQSPVPGCWAKRQHNTASRSYWLNWRLRQPHTGCPWSGRLPTPLPHHSGRGALLKYTAIHYTHCYCISCCRILLFIHDAVHHTSVVHHASCWCYSSLKSYITYAPALHTLNMQVHYECCHACIL